MNYSILLSIAKFSIIEAIRDKFILFILLGIVVLFFMSIFIGELAITESVEMQSTILASLLRLFSVFVIGLFVITSMIREFNDKGFELILSLPVTRASYYFGKYIGFSVIGLFVTIICTICLLFYLPLDNVALWSFSLYLELLIIISLSLLALFTLNSITIAFSLVTAFYILSRLIEVIQLISDSPILATSSLSHAFINGILDIIAFVIPSLYLFTRSEWLIYQDNIGNILGIIIGQSVVYITLISAAALFDLYRKEL